MDGKKKTWRWTAPALDRPPPLPARTLLHCDVHGAGVGGLQQLLVRLSRLVEELHQQRARLLVLAPPDGGQLVQLLLHQSGVVQGVLQTVPARRAEAIELVTCTQGWVSFTADCLVQHSQS